MNGDPLMCILIIADKKPDALVEIGINHTAEMNGNEGDEDFFEIIVDLANYTWEDQPAPRKVLMFHVLSVGPRMKVLHL